MKGYVLVNAEPARAAEVARVAAGVRGVESVDVVEGPFQLIASVEAGTPHELAQVVARAIQEIPGVRRVILCALACHDPLWGERLESLYAPV